MRDWIVIGYLPRRPAFHRPTGSRAALDRFVAEAATARMLNLGDVLGRSRVKVLVRGRQGIMADAYATGRWSYLTIGQAMNRDHSTVVHAVKKVRALAQQEVA